MLVVAALLLGHLGDGLGRAPFVDNGTLVGGGTAAGLVYAEDSAWLRACEEASGGAPVGYFQAAGDRVLAATLDGMIETADRGCAWAPVAGVLRNLEVTAIRAAFAAPATVYLSTGRAGQPNSVWKSVDGGESFTETSLAGVIDPFFDLAVSDDGGSVYVSGFDVDANAPLVRGSRDGGAGFFPITDSTFAAAGYDRIRVLAVDDRVWLSLVAGADAWIASADPDLLEVTIVDQLPGAALALVPFAGGRYIHAEPGVLYRQATPSDPFLIVAGVALTCLDRGDDALHLWACGVPGSGVQFAVSTDGVTFSGALSTAAITDRTCPVGTPAATICVAPVVDAGVPPEDAGADAGASDGGPEVLPDAGDGGEGEGGEGEEDRVVSPAPTWCGAQGAVLWFALAAVCGRRARVRAARSAVEAEALMRVLQPW